MRNSTTFRAIAAIIGVMGATAAAAAETVELTVTGTVTPEACTLVLGENGVIDYGTINATSLRATDYYRLPQQTLGVTITCPNPTRLAMKAQDDRPGTAVPNAMGTGVNAYAFGFGKAANDAPIGAYTITLNTFTGNSEAKTGLYRRNNATSWYPISSSMPTMYADGSAMVGWGVSNTAVGQFKSFTSNIVIDGALNKRGELPTSAEIALDGAATFSVVYL